MTRRPAALALAVCAACASKDAGAPGDAGTAGVVGPLAPVPGAGTSTAAQAYAARNKDTRYFKIRTLLSDDPESRTRSIQLYPLVEPLCTSAEERARFIDDVKWSASYATKEQSLPEVLAIDVVEHVATACARTELDQAIDLVDRAKGVIPRVARLDILRARLLAAADRHDEALEGAKAAIALGSIHAKALAANIEAQRARGRAPGYRAGMFDAAIGYVSDEPSPDWQLIDLAAVLQTRARLLSERAVWEDGEAQRKTLLEARPTWERTGQAPFILAQRSLALDMLCFDAAVLGDSGFGACRKAAEQDGNLGAMWLSGAAVAEAKLDKERLSKLEGLAGDLAKLPKGGVVILATRGDEAELVSWARPAAEVLRHLAERGAKVVLIDRTSSPRAHALVARMLELGGVKPAEKIAAKGDTFAMPCLTAIVAGRQTPKACPFDKATVSRLEKLGPFQLALLVGRDLDAEIDDLKLYGLRAVLLSQRVPLIEKGIDVQLKSLSDAWILSARGPSLKGTLAK